MPGSSTTPGRTGTRDDAPTVLPSGISTPSAPGLIQAFAAQWLAYAHPCRRFAPGLAADDARLGADAVRYSFIAVDLHHVLLAGLPAHRHRNPEPILGEQKEREGVCPVRQRRLWVEGGHSPGRLAMPQKGGERA